jgi:MoxR-like ATPase
MLQPLLTNLLTQIGTVIVGKEPQIRLAVTCLLAGGHLLIEDVPGVGKTTLALALAKSFGLTFQRVQFTSDLMPTDLTGVSVYDRAKDDWLFHAGPLFTQVLLADEINRASPKTQSALLEAMEEQQVSVDGKTHALPAPFFVIATQNPHEEHEGVRLSAGTHPLPDSQLDRFLMRLSLGYPDPAFERQLLAGLDSRALIERLRPVMGVMQLAQAQQAAARVHASEALISYIQRVVLASRMPQWFARGLSPRAALGLLRAAKAFAALDGRDFVNPDDVKAVAPAVMLHRLIALPDATRRLEAQLAAMLASIAL